MSVLRYWFQRRAAVQTYVVATWKELREENCSGQCFFGSGLTATVLSVPPFLFPPSILPYTDDPMKPMTEGWYWFIVACFLFLLGHDKPNVVNWAFFWFYWATSAYSAHLFFIFLFSIWSSNYFKLIRAKLAKKKKKKKKEKRKKELYLGQFSSLWFIIIIFN